MIVEAVPSAEVLYSRARRGRARVCECRAGGTGAACALREARHPRRKCKCHIPFRPPGGTVWWNTFEVNIAGVSTTSSGACAARLLYFLVSLTTLEQST